MMNLFAGSGAMIDQIGQIYAIIRSHEGITRQALASQLDLATTTLNRSLERLLSAGLIRESGLADSSGGRRPSLYQSNPQAGLLLGIDLSAGAARIVLTDLNLKILDRSCIADWTALDGAGRLTALTDACRKLAGEDHLAEGMVFGLGFCLPEKAPTSDHEADQDFSALIDAAAKTSGLPYCSLRTPWASLYAGIWRFVSQTSEQMPADSMLLLRCEEDLILGRLRLLNPSRTELCLNSLSEAIVPSPEKAAPDGLPLGQIATVPAILKRFQRMKDNSRLTWADFCQAALAGKRKAGLILRETARAMAIALLNAAVVHGDRHVMLSGTILTDLPELQPMIQEEIEMLSARSGLRVQLFPPDPEADQPAVGAAALALEQAINQRWSGQ